MVRHAFVTVTDRDFLPGTLASVSSVLHFQPDAEVFVVYNAHRPLTAAQLDCLRHRPRVTVFDSTSFDAGGRHVGAWELKAYATHDLAANFEVIVCIDSDCLLCSNVDDEIARCAATGGFLGGRDGEGADYDETYAPYGIQCPARNDRYMSTSLFFCAVTADNLHVLRRWVAHCNSAVFNATGHSPGHGDQGVLNAVLFSENRSGSVDLLENILWSQHWTYWDTPIEWHEGGFTNGSAGSQRQRAFHTAWPTPKFWDPAHSTQVRREHPQQTLPYAWYLALLWFGGCSRWDCDPHDWLPASSQHLVDDLVRYLPLILSIYPPAQGIWSHACNPVLQRIVSRLDRAND